ncbi:NADP-dependent phosphogluconate dehydrogenase [Compostibacter hankyongensis]|uniref:6-phosphogluconate dehydrogenase, decarboxylating n=1 Tax=Compostibacter hankyongensis TaxID=1007089 RepID=A0ABP8G2K9_9BACT
MADKLFDLGMIGIGVMGKNLLYNMADHGFSVVGYNRSPEKTAALEQGATPNTDVKGVNTMEDLVKMLKAPRKITLLVPAGKPVDDVVGSLLPLLEKGDIIIDAGNSHYTDTLRRVTELQPKGIHFMGMGVSGGESGARLGPSIMPGGDREAYQHVKAVLEAVSAKVNGEPCTAYMGKDAAGHYVKMVHNGIEYAIMQMISEIYDLLHRGLGLDNDELHEVFKTWNEGELQSFLVEITRDIFLKKDDKTGNRLVDMVLDKAGAKGTGKWTSQDAMDLPVAIPSIDIAVSLRTLSAFKEERVKAAAIYKPVIEKIKADKKQFIQEAGEGLFFCTIIAYAQGLALLHNASEELKMDIPMQDVVKIWRGGCIIRSSLLEQFYQAYRKNPQLPNILLDDQLSGLVQSKLPAIRAILAQAIRSGIPAAGLKSALAYFEAYTTERMPTNLIQAQRDYFGAHTYQRIDEEGIFHSEWDQ